LNVETKPELTGTIIKNPYDTGNSTDRELGLFPLLVEL
tara:strand:+ start:49 stop:162 length:114 start_codon:yes stop_codon:yes gene_type:complete